MRLTGFPGKMFCDINKSWFQDYCNQKTGNAVAQSAAWERPFKCDFKMGRCPPLTIGAALSRTCPAAPKRYAAYWSKRLPRGRRRRRRSDARV